jgi:hypothetical protein
MARPYSLDLRNPKAKFFSELCDLGHTAERALSPKQSSVLRKNLLRCISSQRP